MVLAVLAAGESIARLMDQAAKLEALHLELAHVVLVRGKFSPTAHPRRAQELPQGEKSGQRVEQLQEELARSPSPAASQGVHSVVPRRVPLQPWVLTTDLDVSLVLPSFRLPALASAHA